MNFIGITNRLVKALIAIEPQMAMHYAVADVLDNELKPLVIIYHQIYHHILSDEVRAHTNYPLSHCHGRVIARFLQQQLALGRIKEHVVEIEHVFAFLNNQLAASDYGRPIYEKFTLMQLEPESVESLCKVYEAIISRCRMSSAPSYVTHAYDAAAKAMMDVSEQFPDHPIVITQDHAMTFINQLRDDAPSVSPDSRHYSDIVEAIQDLLIDWDKAAPGRRAAITELLADAGLPIPTA